MISIHALREEGDLFIEDSYACRKDFYPRPPRGGRRTNQHIKVQNSGFLSTPSARRATVAGCKPIHLFIISIHALREEGDSSPRAAPMRATISIHALREEGDACS